METKTSEIRQGTIDDSNMEFEITVTLNKGTICAAEGTFITPDDLHEQYIGTNKILIDNVSANAYNIFVNDHRFSFLSYVKIEALL